LYFKRRDPQVMEGRGFAGCRKQHDSTVGGIRLMNSGSAL
jgi:hypothetical protein